MTSPQGTSPHDPSPPISPAPNPRQENNQQCDSDSDYEPENNNVNVNNNYVHRTILRKPAIYLYPEEEIDVSVSLYSTNGEFSVVYPRFTEGTTWKVRAQKNGVIKDSTGREYIYLFWESISKFNPTFDKGFCVSCSDSVTFLEKMSDLFGLNSNEATDFITFWMPAMERNPFNIVSFQFENYDEQYKLDISPKPNCLIRLFMAFKSSDVPVEIPPQEIPVFNRTGFTVVEWGGVNLDE